jgi:hypothetical protein
MLVWVKVEDLVIDPAYQRPIGSEGKRNIRAIVRDFRWSRFTPLVVAAVPGGRFALIDGQHRATAAAVLGIAQLPAQVVIADLAEQADAFRAINGRITKVHACSLHHAAVAAGDPTAREIQEICEAAEVTVLRHPRAYDRVKPGETMAIRAIRLGIGICGRAGVITALQCVTMTENNRQGLLNQAVISALCNLMVDEELRDGGEALLAAFDAIDLETELEAAAIDGIRGRRGVSVVLVDRLRHLVREQLASAPAIAARHARTSRDPAGGPACLRPPASSRSRRRGPASACSTGCAIR